VPCARRRARARPVDHRFDDADPLPALDDRGQHLVGNLGESDLAPTLTVMSGVEGRLAAAERGENPTVLARLKTGWAVIGDTQHLPGYCLLLYRGEANHLTDLPRAERADFLLDMSLLGEAVQNVCSALDPQFRRVNYEVLGNSWPHLHAHVHPRYTWEPAAHRSSPVWTYPDRKDPRHQLDSRHDALRTKLSDELMRITTEAGIGPDAALR
jgi:diadenosine tetraphosphate (Ap4A) HIT family hydrolase